MSKIIHKHKLRRYLSIFLAFVFIFISIISVIPGMDNIAFADTPTKWFQNFELAGTAGNYGLAAKGSQTDATTESAITVSSESLTSIKTVQHGNGGEWNLDILGVTITPQDDVKVSGQTYVDVSMYNYMTFYVKDINSDGGCNLHISFTDADGKVWDTSNNWDTSYINNQNTIKDNWVKVPVPLDKSKIDFSKLEKIQIGSWFAWDHAYYFDDFEFSQNDPGSNPVVTPIAFQNFESEGLSQNYGIAGKGTQTDVTTGSDITAFPESKKSIKTVQHSNSGEWNLDILGVTITPQDDAKVSGQEYADVSKYIYMILYVKDVNGGGQNLHISFKDAAGSVWDTSNDWNSNYPKKLTQKNSWVKLAIPLDKSKIDFSKLSQIQVGTWFGWDNSYYIDDICFTQKDTDNSPYYVPPEGQPSSEPTVLFNDFENGDGHTAGSGVTTAIDSDCVNVNESKSVRMTAANSGMPDSTGNYINIVPKSGTVINAMGHNYLVFYVKDTQGSNTLSLTVSDASGGSWSGWTADGSKKDIWTRIVVPFSSITGVDISKINAIRIGEYNSGTYYFDDFYFAMYEDDTLPGFETQSQSKGSEWYQSFEVKGSDGRFGFEAGTGAAITVETGFSANPYNSRSIKVALTEDSADPSVNGVSIRPQALAPSLDKTQKYDYKLYFNATNFSHLVFYAYDTVGNRDLNVIIDDLDGRKWTFKTSDFNSQVTGQNIWTRFVVPLDKTGNPIDFSKIKSIGITIASAGTYYLDEFYFAKGTGDVFPNSGFTAFNLRSVNGELVPYQNGIALATFEKQSDRDYISLNGTWRKERVTLDSTISAAPKDSARKTAIENEAGARFTSNYDDSLWVSKNLPMPEDEMCTYEAAHGPEGKTDNSGYQSGVWYRRHFSVDSGWNEKNVKLSFLGVNYFADVWINGVYVGGHQGGYTPFAFDVSSILNYGGDNVIAVRVDNTKWDTFANGETIPYKTSDWFNYTGILRDCYLEASNSNYVVRSDIKTVNTDGTIEVKTTLNNKDASGKSANLTYSVYEANVTNENKTSEFAQNLINGIAKVTQSRTVPVNPSSVAVDKFNLNIPDPKLWSPKNPNLYVLKVEESINGRVVDTFYTQFGIRTLKTDGVKILLNGQLAPFLTGVGYTEDSADKGPSMDNSTRYSDLQKIKEDLKANFVRTGHFPHSINSYEYTDRIGLAVWQEIPSYWFSGDAFDLQRQRGQTRQMMSEMIYSNYNRPSVWFDGTCNESGEQLQRVNYITELREMAHEIDGTRLIGQSAVGNPYKGESDASHSAADVIGMTMYFGVFYGSNMDVDTQREIEEINRLHPNKPVIATEYGYWSGDEGPDDTKQARTFNGTFNAFSRMATTREDGTQNSNGLLSGCAWWTAYNWYTNITGIQTMGLYHMDRTKKKQATDILAERYNRYNNISQGATPEPTGMSDWFQSFESGKGFEASDSGLSLTSDTESPKGNGQKGLKIVADDSVSKSYVRIVPQGSCITKDLSCYNYLNFYVKDLRGSGSIDTTIIDSEGNSWNTTANGTTVKDNWTKLSIPLVNMQGERLVDRCLNSLAITEIRIGISSPGTVFVDDLYLSSYTSDVEPQTTPAGNSGWFQSFEADGTSVAAGTDANAAINDYGVNPNGKKSVKLDVSKTGNPGANGHCVIITPQGRSAAIDASGFNYLCFYVKDTQGSNTVALTFVDADGGVSSDVWTPVSSIKNQWTKMYVPLDKVSADLRQIKEIRLAEWNEGTYYFDDLFFAESLSDEIPNTYTEEVPVKPIPEGLKKVACIGDSITAGAALSNPGVTSYPAQLQVILGSDKYLVKNFGVSGRTLQKSGDSPYWNETAFENSKNFKPDIVIIQLGTNDTKPWNWKDGTNNFKADYIELINTYKNLPSHPKVYINLPPWIYNDDPAQAYAILSSVLQNGVIPEILEAASATEAKVIDVNSATGNMSGNFPDKIHPNAAGAWVIANTVAKAINGEYYSIGETSVTKWKDNKASAYTITYDDGILNSVLKFEELNKKYGLKASLALINDWVNRQYNDMGSSTGTWQQWKEILDRGYFDVASHTYTHRDLTKLTRQEINKEFVDSVSEIYEKTGHMPEAMATPYGASNDIVKAEAGKYFVVSRGLGGTGNLSDTTKYQNLSSTLADSTTTVGQLNTWLDNGIAKGNWLVFAAHGCDGEGWSSPNLNLFDNHYAYLKTRMDSVWNDTLANVGKYLKERENATVSVLPSDGTQILITLTDTLDDAVYNFPLTLKTRVPDSWTSVQVSQGRRSLVLSPVTEGTVKFIYYDAIPDGGQILITEKKAGQPEQPGQPGQPGQSGQPGSGQQVISDSTIKVGQNGTVTIEVRPVKPDSNGTAVFEVGSKVLEDAFKKAKTDNTEIKTIVIELPKVEGTKKYELTIPTDTLMQPRHGRSIHIKTEITAITVPDNMLDRYTIEKGSKATFSISHADISNFDNKLKAAIGGRPAIDLGLKINGKDTAWNKAYGPVMIVSIPYTPSAEEIQNLEHIVVWYIDNSGKAIAVPVGRYDPATGMVTFKTARFGRYTLAYVNKTFSDLSGYSWAANSIGVLASKGIADGTSDETFSPGIAITRGEYISWLIKTLGLSADLSSNFDDLSKTSKYYDEIGIARKLGICNGVGSNKFSPDKPVSRQDMMVLTLKALKVADKKLLTGTKNDIKKYSDVSKIAGYAVESVATMVREGFIVGNGKNINPNSNTTRAEAAQVLYKILCGNK